MKQYVCRSIVIVLLLLTQCVRAQTLPINFDWENGNVADAIRLLAAFTNLNVIISPNVQGLVTLHLHQVPPTQALNLLLTMRGLAKWQSNNIWYIASQEELIQRKQNERKWQDALRDATPLFTECFAIKYAQAENLAHLLQRDNASLLSKRGQVRVDSRTNTLCVAESATALASLRQLLARLDIPVKQIMIAARLASVDSDYERELGIDFSVQGDAKANGQKPGHYNIAVARLADGSRLEIKLAALENAGHAELISSPSLFMANQQTASIEAGEEVPYQEVSESGGTAVVFKKAVVGLKVTPQLLPGDKVLLQLQINQDRPSNKMVLGMPTINTRQMTTNVLIRNGQTIVLGGIYETTVEQGEQGLPFIRQLPVLGWLLKQQTLRRSKRELLIFVTPKIMS